MRKLLLIMLFFCGFACGYAQDLSGGVPAAKTPPKVRVHTRSKTEVFLSAGVHCLFTINGRRPDTLYAGEPKKLSLKPGYYKLLAKAITTGDTAEVMLDVKQHGIHSFTIPLQAVMDKRIERQSDFDNKNHEEAEKG